MWSFNLTPTILLFLLAITKASLLPSIKDFRHNDFVKEYDGKTYKQILSGLKLTRNDLHEAIGFASSSVEKMHRFEINLNSADINVKTGTPTKGLYIVNSPNNISIARAKDALIVTKATGYLINKHHHQRGMPAASFSEMFTSLDFMSLPVGKSCQSVNKFCTWEEHTSPYRLADGSCNNHWFGSRGESNTVYKRLLFPDYLDGVSEFRRSTTKRPLPSARSVSTFLVRGDNETATDLTSAVSQWWQFIEQDLTQTAASVAIFTGKEIECCDDGYKLSPRYQHSFCAPIIIPEDDKFYSSHYLNCMPYIRSLPGLRHECNFGPREQVNQATHYMDGSQIYGSTLHQQADLRSYDKGKLKVFKQDGKEFLPLSNNPTNDCQLNSDTEKCFKSGDSRVNLHPYMTTLHLLWHREHNRVAEELAKLNEQWDDETIFQQARRIVIAELQHITYEEYLPIILGRRIWKQVMKKDDYNKDIDARVSNSFATAALRSLNSLVDDTVNLYTEERTIDSSLDLEEHFNKPEILLKKDILDKLIRSLGTQLSQKQDVNYANDITSKLYSNGVYGLDVLSLDIQRGRDHGLKSYVHYRKLYGQAEAKYFDHFEDVMSREAYSSLIKIYDDPQDVDLIVGGLLERPEDGAQIGPTFACIIKDQMYRTKVGDRYFYTNKEQPSPFTSEQIAEIKKTSLSRIMCDNSDNVKRMQPNAFKYISAKNKLRECSELPKIHLSKWK